MAKKYRPLYPIDRLIQETARSANPGAPQPNIWRLINESLRWNRGAVLEALAFCSKWDTPAAPDTIMGIAHLIALGYSPQAAAHRRRLYQISMALANCAGSPPTPSRHYRLEP
jgi:hypothetical protein